MGAPDLQPADQWQLRRRTLLLGKIPLLMGVINVTPDSFSDGGRFLEPGVAVEHALQLAAEGADLLDVGGQSTRPGSQPVDAEEELRRAIPVVTALCRQTTVPVAIDTCKAVVAREALAAGAEVINDVTALTGEAAMLPLAVQSGCGVCAMHMQGTPSTMQQGPSYDDVVAEVLAYLQARRDALTAAGVAPGRIALDPGIGFGKTTEHNLALLGNMWRFHALDCPHDRCGVVAGRPGGADPPRARRGAGPPGPDAVRGNRCPPVTPRLTVAVSGQQANGTPSRLLSRRARSAAAVKRRARKASYTVLSLTPVCLRTYVRGRGR
jgi:dihydropteroate synthase